MKHLLSCVLALVVLTTHHTPVHSQTISTATEKAPDGRYGFFVGSIVGYNDESAIMHLAAGSAEDQIGDKAPEGVRVRPGYKKKSSTIAALWSVIPGGGMFYARKPLWGAVYLAAGVGFTALFWSQATERVSSWHRYIDRGGSEAFVRNWENKTDSSMVAAGVASYLGISLAGLVHSLYSVKAYNRSVQDTYSRKDPKSDWGRRNPEGRSYSLHLRDMLPPSLRSDLDGHRGLERVSGRSSS